MVGAESHVAAAASPGVAPRPSLNVRGRHRRRERRRASPGVAPRPSLNVRAHLHRQGPAPGVAGGSPPALIERTAAGMRASRPSSASPGVAPRPSLNVRRRDRPLALPFGVAGGSPPALIERTPPRPRPSCTRSRVAGGSPPALIERSPKPTCRRTGPGRASPGVAPRPSLNAGHPRHPHGRQRRRASPGVAPRPSLNERQQVVVVDVLGGVAGGSPPALIERSTGRATPSPKPYCVAGGSPPALIERGPSSPSRAAARRRRRG